MSTRTIAITDRSAIEPGDIVTIRVTDTGPGTDNGDMDYEFVSAVREVPEWAPGTTGTAHVVSGDATTKGGRVFRKMRGMVVHRPAPIDDDMFVTVEGELWGLEGEYCKNFVPDEPRPTREALTTALQETAQERETRSSFAEDADLILAALQRGES